MLYCKKVHLQPGSPLETSSPSIGCSHNPLLWQDLPNPFIHCIPDLVGWVCDGDRQAVICVQQPHRQASIKLLALSHHHGLLPRRLQPFDHAFFLPHLLSSILHNQWSDMQLQELERKTQ